jgi:hypothetical protein
MHARTARPVVKSTVAARCVALGGALALLAACGAGNSGGQATRGPSPPAPPAASSSSASTTPAGGPGASGGEPGIVAVTTKGALVTLSPANGAVTSTLVASGAIGDEIAVATSGTVYFTAHHGCTDQIESVPVSGGGSPAPIATGSLPALSADGSKLAFAREPPLTTGCVPATPNLVPLYKLVVRTLSTGAEATYPMVPPSQQKRSLPAPISHLSWAADGQHLAVSVAAFQDNEGWNLALLDTAAAKYYLSGAGVSFVPVTGQPSRRLSYLREGVYLPNGELFVSRACCAGFPPHNTSRLMWEVSTAGALVHQVAIGFASLDHTSLAVAPGGGWLLYLAGHDLYVSQGGARPRQVASGLVAAAWH